MGRDKRNETRPEHFTKLMRHTMETEAWRALSPFAQAVYPWLKLEWRGPRANNNGKIALSVRQAAERVGMARHTTMKAYHELQAKGFIVMRQHAQLGTEGAARTAEFEITELPMPGGDDRDGRHLYRQWREGRDFPVHKAAVHNPTGRTRRTSNVVKLVTEGGR